MHLTGAGEQATVEVIDCVAQLIIICIEVVLAFQQLHLTLHATLLEHLDGLFDGALYAMDGHICIDDFLHSPFDATDILVFHRTPQAKLTVITSAHGAANEELSIGISIFDSLCQDEEERAGIGAHTALIRERQELHILVVVEAVVHALHLIVDASSHRPIIHVEVRLGKGFIEITAKRHTYPLSIITTAYS